MINLVEVIADDQYPSPCKYGNIVDGHACYCHQPDIDVRKCPIWRNYGVEKKKWHNKGDWDKEDWNGGCKYFEVKK